VPDAHPERSERVVLSAIRRFNQASRDHAGSDVERGDGAPPQFRLGEIAYLGSTILAIGELHQRGASDPGTARPLVLSWQLDSTGQLRELTAFDSEAEATEAIEPPQAPLRVRNVGFTR